MVFVIRKVVIFKYEDITASLVIWGCPVQIRPQNKILLNFETLKIRPQFLKV